MAVSIDYLFGTSRGGAHYAVAHRYEVNGDLVPDPDVEFFVVDDPLQPGAKAIYPTAIDHGALGYHRHVHFDSVGQPARVASRGQGRPRDLLRRLDAEHRESAKPGALVREPLAEPAARALSPRSRGSAEPRRHRLFPASVPAAALIAERAYLPTGASLLKIVVALPGDAACVDERSFVANDHDIGAIARRDSAGRALAPFLFCGAVPAGRAFVATPAPLSFDSRYFGPVPVVSLTVAVPVWTY
jgi:hypothetical protein